MKIEGNEHPVTFFAETLKNWAQSLRIGEKVFLRRYSVEGWKYAIATVVKESYINGILAVNVSQMGAVQAGTYGFDTENPVFLSMGGDEGYGYQLKMLYHPLYWTMCNPVPVTPETESAYNNTQRHYASRERAIQETMRKSFDFDESTRASLLEAIKGVDFSRMGTAYLRDVYTILLKAQNMLPDYQMARVQDAHQEAAYKFYGEGFNL